MSEGLTWQSNGNLFIALKADVVSGSESTTAPRCHGVSRYGLTNETEPHVCLPSEHHMAFVLTFFCLAVL